MGILKIILITVFLIAALAVTVIVLCQEGKSAGLGSLSGTVGNSDSYWDKNKKYSLSGKLERWTKMAAMALVLSALAIMLVPNEKSSSNTVDTEVKTEATATPTASPEESTTAPQ